MAAIATLGEAENHPTTPITALEMPIREEIPAKPPGLTANQGDSA